MRSDRTWRGARGAVLLGPTEDRVARYLDAATKHGRVTFRTVELASRLNLERSEAYRITRRLRVLGLFGIENDKAGTRGGRRYWRTATRQDGSGLNARRHRVAWARVVAWTRARGRAVHRALAHLRQRTDTAGLVGSRPTPSSPVQLTLDTGSTAAMVGPPFGKMTGGPTFADMMSRAGIGSWIDDRRTI